MGIKEITAAALGKKNKAGWRFDKKRELWVTYQARGEFDGVPKVKRGFKTARAAEDYLDQLKVQNRLKQIGVVQLVKFPTVRKLFDAHLAKIESRRARQTATRIFKRFLSDLPKNLRLDELARKHFVDYVGARLKDGVTAATAHREITDISSAIHSAGDYFKQLENWDVPDKLIFRPSVADEGRSRVITRDERSSLLDYLLRAQEPAEKNKDFTARRRTGLIFYFGLLTGLRHGEISGLEKTNYDPELRRLKAERFKTRAAGVRWTIFEPLTDTQAWILSEASDLYSNGDFFFSEAGKPHNKFYEIMKNACEKLKIEYGKNNPKGFIMHDTRHTFVTVLDHGAVDSSTTRSFSGHSKDAMMKRYAHATPDSRARAMQLIERELGDAAAARHKEPDEERLQAFYERVQTGQISFEEFKSALESFDGFLKATETGSVQNVQIVQVGI